MNLLLLCLTADLFIEMGYFVKMGLTIVTLYDFSLYYLFFFCVIDYIIKPFKISPLFYGLICLYLLPLCGLLLFPSDILIADSYRVTWDDVIFNGARPVHPEVTNLVIKDTFKFFFSAFIVQYMYHKFFGDDYKLLIVRFSRIITVFLIIGILEYIKNFTGGISEWASFTELFFGTTPSTVYESRLRGDLYELNLFTKEASHYAYTLFIAMIILLAKNIIVGKKSGFSFSIIICIILMMLSTSFSIVLFLPAFGVIYLLYRWCVFKPSSMRYEKILLFISVILGGSSFIAFILANEDGFVMGRIVLLFENIDLLFDINNNITFGDDSTYVRVMSVLQTFYAYLNRPLFGFSLGSMACHGATAMMISGIGIIGVFFWTKYYFYTSPLYVENRVSQYKFHYLLVIIVYFLINSLNSISLRPFYDSTVMAFVICLCSLFKSFTKQKKNYGECINYNNSSNI